jgi:hypothetical protein
MIAAWMDGLTGKRALPSFATWAATARATLKLVESAATGTAAWWHEENR